MGVKTFGLLEEQVSLKFKVSSHTYLYPVNKTTHEPPRKIKLEEY